MQQSASAFLSQDEPDDRTLLLGIQSKDEEAFAMLVRRHTQRFYRLAYRFTANREEAEDIVQDAFLKLWERPHVWNASSNASFTTWFYRVVVNLSLDKVKKKKPLPLIDDTRVKDDRASPEGELAEKQDALRIERALAALPKRQQVALNLCFYEGLSNQEAADVMQIHLKALQSLIMRAKTTLKQELMAKG